LFEEHLTQILQPLEGQGLSDVAYYFYIRQRRSGIIESGVKQFKTRLTGLGMRWSRPSVERMLVIRPAVLQGSFDTFWHRATTEMHPSQIDECSEWLILNCIGL
jgi:hypothetical protein